MTARVAWVLDLEHLNVLIFEAIVCAIVATAFTRVDGRAVVHAMKRIIRASCTRSRSVV